MPEPLSRMHRDPSSAISGRAKKWVGAGKGWVCCGQRRLTVAAASDAAPSHGRHRIWGARHQQAAPASLSLVALDPRVPAGPGPRPRSSPTRPPWAWAPCRPSSPSRPTCMRRTQRCSSAEEVFSHISLRGTCCFRIPRAGASARKRHGQETRGGSSD